MTKAVVLLSGGIDSSTVLAIAREQGHIPLCVSFNYGQLHSKELIAAEAVARFMKSSHRIIGLSPTSFMGAAITSGGPEVPTGSYKDVQAGKQGPISTYVPFRNGQLISAGTAIAVQEKASFVYFAAHASDAADWAYPDCTPEFLGAMANAVWVGTDRQVRLVFPLIWMTKDQVVKTGHKLKVPFELTWSCYKGERLHCGVCPTCIERSQAFRLSKIHDPTQYEPSSQFSAKPYLNHRRKV